ncbi:PrgI family protein [Candidatus Parcubacteria bacterium]|nr:PrgI family protein [Candidatus Parcubacteria bacterium]
MQFTVPKFIEREAKIVGPFTFKQFIYVGIAGAISFVLYFTIPIAQCLIAATILIGSALALAFIKIEGRSLPTIIKDFFVFSSSPKLYIWKKKGLLPKFLKKESASAEAMAGKKKKEASGLVVTSSKLGQLSSQLETKTK